VRATFTTSGAAGVFFIASASVLAKNDAEGRLTMTDVTLTMGNSNDLASHLILVLPFIMFIAMDKQRAALIRYSLIVPMALALKMVLGTASRGGLVALVVVFLFVILRASARQKMVTLVAAAVLAVTIPLVLNGNALDRLTTLFRDQPSADGDQQADLQAEARESKDLRSYLLQQSLIYTLQNPVFGIGLGQFSNYVGEISKANGKVGAWNETHNTFTQVSSECGMPALIFFVLGIVFAFSSVNKTYRRARREGHKEIANMSFCYLVSMVGFLSTIIFLANAYRFYLPAMIGLAIALSTVAERKMSAEPIAVPARNNGWTPPPARGRMA
jgi:O-antigen ligase